MRETDMQQHGMTAMIRSMAWDLGLPLAAYYALHTADASDTAALLAGSGAAGVRLVWVAARSRALSAFSMVMGAVFGVGLLFTLLTGDPRFLLVKHSAMAAVIGSMFLITAFRGRPLTLAAQQSFMPKRAAELAEAYATTPEIRHGHRVASLVWGGGLLAEAVVRAALVYTLPISVMVGLSTALTVVTFAALIGWNARYIATHSRPAATPAPLAA
ncbi:VC0807 family protein [Actinoplanes sp. NPDC051513]|uniref:VC0807 family protein n=1 Tax=Actinoplanes sp. NPDC051513 TaxID=3363908 RepID=UPI0037A6BA24